MKRNLLLLCMACSALAHAQFSGTYAPANWTLTRQNSANSTASQFGTVNTAGAPNNIQINGPDGQTNNYAIIRYSITLSQTSTVSFNYSLINEDMFDWGSDAFFWGFNNTKIDSASTGSGTVTISVSAGQTLVLGVGSIDDQGGPVRATISNFSVTTTPLPVSGSSLSVKASGNINVLNWTTYTEDNNQGFEIQRSLDARTFNLIGFVSSKSAMGHSKTALDYTFSDNAATKGAVYYRYRQVDRDGGESYSNVVIMQPAAATAQSSWMVYPNPLNNTEALSLNNRSEGTLKLFDAKGTLVHTQYVGKQAKIQLPAHLTAGTYFTVLQTVAGRKQSATLVIQ